MNKLDTNRILALGLVGLLMFTTSCKKEASSLFDPNYESSHPTPVITSITPASGYLAGVDSVIINGENFATDLDSMTLNFGGVPGIIYKSTKTQMVVRPGYKVGDEVQVRLSVRGSEFFSNSFSYKLDDPFNYYAGTGADHSPLSAIAIDENDNIYTIVDNSATGRVRYSKIAPDGTITLDGVKVSGEARPSLDDTRPYPTDSTMRFTQYSSIVYAGNDLLLMSQQSIRAIFQKTFGDDKRESVWKASSVAGLKIMDMVADSKGNLWVVGLGSNNIHRFDMTTKDETIFPFTAELNAVAVYDDFIFVGGVVDGNREIWRFPVDANGDLGAGEKYFDFQANYDGSIRSMILASNGDLIIATAATESLVRVFPNKSHEAMYDGVIKEGAFSLTWRSDRFMVVGVNGDEASINFLDTYDKSRDGVY